MFEPTIDGFRVKKSGTYLIDGKVKVNERNQANTYAIGVNGRVDPTKHTTFATDGTGQQISSITTQLDLNAGDEVSLNLVSQGTSQLSAWPGLGTTQTPGSPTLVLSGTKIA